jgi:hypothetical protein
MRATAFLAVLLSVGIVWLALHVPVDALYSRAERLYQAGDYEKAAVLCERALRRSPGHVPARALFMEVQFILGQGKTSSSGEDYQMYMGDWRPAAILWDMDQALARAELSGDERESRKVLELAKWAPDGVEVRSRVDQARAHLERVSGPAASGR